MQFLTAAVLTGLAVVTVHHAEAIERPMTIAVFTKNSTNPAYAAFRFAADQIARASGAKAVHYVPKKPDDVDEQKAFVEQVLKDRPDVVIFIPVDDVAMIELGEEAQRGENPYRARLQSAARQLCYLCRRR